MKSADSAMLYNTHPVVSELNRVKGFDPLKFVKTTAEGPKLELKYKKLWFRLKYPQGRFKFSALKITDQLAIIEARVFFDKNDTEPKAAFTARSDKATAPGGMYIEAAQYAAIDQALTDAGFGLQFMQDTSGAAVPKVEKSAAVEKVVAPPEEPAVTKKKEPDAVSEPVVAAAPVVEEPKAKIVEEPAPKLEIINTVATETVPAATVADAPVEVVPTAPMEEVAEAPAEVAAAAPTGGYTNDMSVEEICARMTLEEAENYIVPLGTCNGQTMGQVADRRPASLRYYISGYNGDNNILRAAATLVSESRSQKAS